MIREAKLEDLEDVLKLYQQLFPAEDYSSAETFSNTWLEIIKDDKITCYLTYEGNIAVATCIITIIPNLTRNQKSYAVIENVITHSDYRYKGYGKAIMEKATNYAIENNCYKVMLLSSSKRVEAHKFYEKIGYDGDSKKGFQFRICS
ncbi:MAG: GNAT family N-acetyltransferase [Spirochaetaceae bacterium]